MKNYTVYFILILITTLCFQRLVHAQTSLTYPIIKTKQVKYYNNSSEISAPTQGQAFYGQDAHYQEGFEPSYTNNGDGSISDNVTGLMWQKAYSRANYDEAFSIADTSTTAGYTDWRVPTIKELYSLIYFSGSQGSGSPTDVNAPDDAVPYINTDYFDFSYPNDGQSRYIDVQYISSTLYVGTVFDGEEAFFGLNLADGRIKGYETTSKGGNQRWLRLVRGTTSYGVNDFVDNMNNTITDNATGLMWSKDDSGGTPFSQSVSTYTNTDGSLNWEEALDFAENAYLEGYSDWRLPNSKEIHSILDYTRAPDVTSSAAVDPLFNCTGITNEAGEADYPFYWSSTSHTATDASDANILQFGRSLGYMNLGAGPQFYDVHGAGGQRTDPKSGTPNYGGGPQGDVRRVYNYVRLVRNADTDVATSNNMVSQKVSVYPNPTNGKVNINLAELTDVSVKVLDMRGQIVYQKDNVNTELYSFSLNLKSGVYFVEIISGEKKQLLKLVKE